MNAPNRTTTTKSVGSQDVREAAEVASSQTKQTFEKMKSATTDATALMKNSYLATIRHAHHYNTKLIEFAEKNSTAGFEFAQELSNVKSPTEFLELSTSHSRKQFETLTEQARELATLAQKVALASVERVNQAA
jgi:phasin